VSYALSLHDALPIYESKGNPAWEHVHLRVRDYRACLAEGFELLISNPGPTMARCAGSERGGYGIDKASSLAPVSDRMVRQNRRRRSSRCTHFQSKRLIEVQSNSLRERTSGAVTPAASGMVSRPVN